MRYASRSLWSVIVRAARVLDLRQRHGWRDGQCIHLTSAMRQQAKEREMAAKDAEMPAHHGLSEEIQEIAKHLQTLRKDIEGLTGSIKSAGGHQAERMQDAAG